MALLRREEIWNLMNSAYYVDNELDFSEEIKTELKKSDTYNILKEKISKENRDNLKKAILNLKDEIRTRMQEINELMIANDDTKKILSEQLQSYTTMSDVQTINSILTSDILVQDSELNYTIPYLTNEALQTVSEMTELNYRYEQVVNMQKKLELKSSFLTDLFRRIDNILFILESIV